MKSLPTLENRNNGEQNVDSSILQLGVILILFVVQFFFCGSSITHSIDGEIIASRPKIRSNPIRRRRRRRHLPLDSMFARSHWMVSQNNKRRFVGCMPKDR